MRPSARVGSALPRLYAAVSRLGWRRSAVLDALFRRAYFLYKRVLEDPFHNLARRSPELFRGGHVLDVGANIGYTASVFARAVDAGFGVWAFEPEGANFDALQALARRDRRGVIHPVRAAVGERDGELELWVNEEHPGDHRVRTGSLAASPSSERFGRSEKVRQLSIDGFLEAMDPPLGPIRFVKIDVQGYELPVCRGMARLLASARGPICVAMEYDPAMMRDMGFDPAECLRFFLERGFELRLLEQSGKALPCAASELEAHLGPRGYRDLLLTRAARAGEPPADERRKEPV
jgi:FkbM family methyltransferase